ncbi:MAG: hypothetical protein LC776_11915 [Acidobacteria bacterium]|nr:hypothetical protein [Acidobacteriota bacterium]
MTTLGLIFLTAAVAAVWRFGRNALPWLLSAAIALPSSAALVAGGNGLVPFYAIAPFALAATVLALLRRQKRSQSGREQLGCTALCLFVAWTLVITALGPTVFAGVSVLRPRGGIDNEIASPSRLDYTISHVAQIAYLLLGVSVVFFLAQRGRLSPALPAAGFGLGTGLSSLVLLAEQVGLLWPANLFSNSPTLRYIDYTQQLEPRFRGVFVEPAALAAFSIAAMAFFVSFIAQSRGRARVWSAGGGALCGVNHSSHLLQRICGDRQRQVSLGLVLGANRIEPLFAEPGHRDVRYRGRAWQPPSVEPVPDAAHVCRRCRADVIPRGRADHRPSGVASACCATSRLGHGCDTPHAAGRRSGPVDPDVLAVPRRLCARSLADTRGLVGGSR